MSYLGLRILLHRASQIDGVACERVFMPWFDAERLLRRKAIPLFTLETRTPLNELDLLGFNLQYELHATNILAMLDLGGLPLRASQRREADPIILAGGSLALHSEPFAPIFDALALGDGEDIFPEILDVLKREKRKGSSREKKVRALGDIPGVYLPNYYHPRFSPSGEYLGLICSDSSLPRSIRARLTPTLKPDFYPSQPIVPLVETTHNRLILEIARGCSRGCRFCSPGMINRPVREKPIADLIREAESGLSRSGYSQMSLLSLSTADYGRLDELLEALQPILDSRQVSLSFPSLRPDRFTAQMADRAAAGSRTGLTLAPEAATPRLRAVINKETSDDDLLNAARLAYERRWKSIKLYFMVGLPTETDEDVYALVDLVRRVVHLGKEFGGRGVNVSISPFTPKPHTPFEREGQLPLPDLQRRIGILKAGLRLHRSVRLEIRDLEVTQVEAAIARGDRRMADAIEASYRLGGLFDAWTDGFSMPRWEDSFRRAGLDLTTLTGPISNDQCLPWEHLRPGVAPEFLAAEREAAARAEFTPDCRQEVCHLCGLQLNTDLACPEIYTLEAYSPSAEILPESHGEFRRYRLAYRRTNASRYVAHLEAVGVLERALRQVGMPLEFTVGMRPHPRLIASPPLPVGMTSQGEYLDFGLAGDWTSPCLSRLQAALPPGFDVINVIHRPAASPSLGALEVFLYHAERNPSVPARVEGKVRDRIADFLNAAVVSLLHRTAGQAQTLNARPAVWRLEETAAGDLLIGLKRLPGPTPRALEILQWLTDETEDELKINWKLERGGMWWESAGGRKAPMESWPEDVVHTETLLDNL